MRTKPFVLKIIFFLFFASCFFTQSVSAQNADDACAAWKVITKTEFNNNERIRKAAIYESQVDESCRVGLYLEVALAYRSQRKKDSAYHYFDKTITLAKKADNIDMITYAYTTKAYMIALNGDKEQSLEQLKKARIFLEKDPGNISWIFYHQAYAFFADVDGEYKRAIKYTDSSIAVAEKYKHNGELDICYLNNATYHLRFSDYEGALRNSLKSLEIIEKKGSKRNLESAYYLIGVCYDRLGQDDTAIDYLYKSINRCQEIENDVMSLYSYDRLVSTLFDLKRYEEGEIATDSLIVIAQRVDDKAMLASGYKYKADVLIEQKKYDQAEVILLAARQEVKRSTSYLKNTEFKNLETLQGLLNLKLKQRDFPEMLKYLKEYDEVLETSDQLSYKSSGISYYSSYYEGVGNPTKALELYKEWVTLKDSVLNEETKLNIADLEKKYQTKKNELEIVKLNEEKALQEVETKKAETKQYLYLGIAIITLLALITGLIIFLKIKKQQRDLQKAHKEVTELNKVKDHLFSILAHDLRGMILPFQRVGKILKYHIGKGNYEKTEELAMELERNSQNLSDVLNNLLNWSLEQMNHYKVNLTKMSVTEELEEIVDGFKQHSSYKNTVIQLDCNTKDILFDKGAFHLIFRNLIGNALKYTEDGIIKITAINRDNDVTFTVEDNGIGISKEKATKIFSLEKEQSTTGTKGEKGTGLGLNLVHRFVKLHKGSIDVTPRAPKGTSFNLFFPDCVKIIQE